jgi:hypothetical protein
MECVNIVKLKKIIKKKLKFDINYKEISSFNLLVVSPYQAKINFFFILFNLKSNSF